MTTQPEMFGNLAGKLVPRDVCLNRHGGNPQSNAAFGRIEDHLNEAQQRVLNTIKCSDDGFTVDELAVVGKTTPNAISGRITELRIKGKIEKKGTRLTRSGCKASVWIAKT